MEPAPIPPPTGDVVPRPPREYSLREAAVAHRALVRWFLVNAVSAIAYEWQKSSPPTTPIGALFLITLVLLLLCSEISLAVASYRIAGALQTGPPWMSALFIFVPCLNFIWIYSLNGLCRKALRGAGVRVGLLGANLADLDAKGL